MSKFKLSLKEQAKSSHVIKRGQVKGRLIALGFLLILPFTFVWYSLLEGFPETWKGCKSASKQAFKVAVLPWEESK